MIGCCMKDYSFKIVWFPKNFHAEMSVGNKIHYFIGSNDRYGHRRNLSYSLSNSARTPVVLFGVAAQMDAGSIYGMIEKRPPSFFNTCMGSVADIARKISFLEIPALIGQSPELSALYLMLRHFAVGDISFDTHGISKTDAVFRACKVGGVQVGAFAFSCYYAFSSMSHLIFADHV